MLSDTLLSYPGLPVCHAYVCRSDRFFVAVGGPPKQLPISAVPPEEFMEGTNLKIPEEPLSPYHTGAGEGGGEASIAPHRRATPEAEFQDSASVNRSHPDVSGRPFPSLVSALEKMATGKSWKMQDRPRFRPKVLYHGLLAIPDLLLQPLF